MRQGDALTKSGVTNLSAQLLDLLVNVLLGQGGSRNTLHISRSNVTCTHNL